MPDQPMSTRLRKTRRLVRAEDRAARAIITVGGIGVVAAVLGICVYLLITVLPLFEGGSAKPIATPTQTRLRSPAALLLDEDAVAATSLAADGSLTTVLIADGSPIAATSLAATTATPPVLSPINADGVIVGAEADGSIWFAALGFSATLLGPESASLPDGVIGASLQSGAARLDPASTSGGFLHRTATGQTRLTVPTITRGPSIRPPNPPANLRLVAGAISRTGQRSLALLGEVSGSPQGVLGTSRTVTPLGGAPREEWTWLPFSLAAHSPDSTSAQPAAPAARPDWLFLTSDGSSLLALYASGDCIRLAPVAGSLREVERRRLVEPGRRATSATMLLGGLTLVVGDNAGYVHGWFTARDPDAGTPDSTRLVDAHRFAVSDAPVVSLVPASRDRLLLAADADGHATLVHMTSHKRVARVDSRIAQPAAIALSPRADTILLAAADGRLDPWSVTLGHPKASFHALFGRPLYEGQTRGEYIYQSSAGSDQAELKMSMVPLLFGTLKATLFATLVAIPLAVLAAVYTSEFLSPRSRRVVKPVIELMASLPSVVLGFVASIVVAPLLAAWLPSVLACLLCVPMAVLIAAHLWQAAPPQWVARLRGGRQLALVAVCAAIGVGVGVALTPALQSALFKPSRTDTLVRAGSTEDIARDQWPAWIGDRRSLTPPETRLLREQGLAFRAGRLVRGVEPSSDRAPAIADTIARNNLDKADLRAWLDGTIGGPTPGWLVVLFPPSMIVAWLTIHAATRRHFERFTTPGVMAIADALRLAAIIAATLAIDVLASLALSAASIDPRDSILGPFSVRNSMVVGIIMGFAIIPIIYTISDDAMRGVPNGLRQASLGAGATQWQTATRVVLPVAASGIFSACMIGLGRAVGETMIVLMATGNSPEMNWNIFSGFRTLAANIAVELPESDKGSTHYRLLFLCGLLLFALTFAINTTAEIVRQHFRKKNANL